ncbi:MAG: hypothetical protein KDA20_07830 [Phycisphaerales bacterium]|nr:hypothetical protein [Phycisphaerales bacterium]
MTRRFNRIAPALLVCGAASTTNAQEAPPQAEPSRLSVTLDGGAQTILEADLDGPDATVSVTRADANATISFQAHERWRFSLDLGTGFLWYDFDGELDLGAGDILDNARTHDIRFTAIHIIDQTWSVVAGGMINASLEDGADVGDSLTYGGFGAVGYRANERLSLRFGAAVRTQLEDNALLLPYIGVQYQLSDTTALRSKGLGLEFSMQINDELTASIFAQYDLHAFRLADDNPVLSAGVLEDRMIIVGASAMWRPDPQWSINATVGTTVWREFSFRNDSSNDLGDVETDTAPVLALRASFDF